MGLRYGLPKMSVPSETHNRLGSPRVGALLTTGQAAKLCAVDPRTIARWVDAGRVQSHRTVGGRRRILHADLLAFMRTQGMTFPPRIAVVDDDPRVVKAISRTVARVLPNSDRRSANDGFTAGALLASFRPHLVFLDIVLPCLSGVELCENIRALPELADTAVVIVSGHLSAEHRDRLLAAGANCFVFKPFTSRDIEMAVAQFLDVRQAVGP